MVSTAIATDTNDRYTVQTANHSHLENQHMSKSLRSYPEYQRSEVVTRRLASATSGGLGTLAAQAYAGAVIRARNAASAAVPVVATTDDNEGGN